MVVVVSNFCFASAVSSKGKNGMIKAKEESKLLSTSTIYSGQFPLFSFDYQLLTAIPCSVPTLTFTEYNGKNGIIKLKRNKNCYQ